MQKRQKKFQFEKSLNELESIVERMESGDMPLDESLKHFEQGVKLTQSCSHALKDAEQTVKVLVETSDTLEDFDIDELDDD